MTKKIGRYVGILALLALLGAIASYALRSFPILLLSVALVLSCVTLRLPSAVKPFGISVVASISGLFIAECVGFVLQQAPSTKYDPTSSYTTEYFRSGDIGSYAKEGVHSTRKLSADGQEIYVARYTIGPDGFRKTPAPPGANGASTRVNFFGCSFTFGEGLNDNETMPYFFQAAAATSQVRNFGFHGYGVHNALAILESSRDTGAEFNVLLTAPWHAARSACKPTWVASSPRYVVRDGELVRVGVCGDQQARTSFFHRVLRHSHMYKLLEEWKRERVVDEDFALYLKLVERVHEVSNARGQGLIIGFIKAEESYFDGSTYTNQRLALELAKSSDGFVDLTLAERVEDLDARYFIHSLDQHPSKTANEVRAKLIARELSRAESRERGRG